jgi:hypothetical protein
MKPGALVMLLLHDPYNIVRCYHNQGTDSRWHRKDFPKGLPGLSRELISWHHSTGSFPSFPMGSL